MFSDCQVLSYLNAMTSYCLLEIRANLSSHIVDVVDDIFGEEKIIFQHIDLKVYCCLFSLVDSSITYYDSN